METERELAIATFGSGCFWCTEAIFLRLKGVESVVSGYAGGSMEDPTYEEVSNGKTGHAEVVQVTFDPAIISYEQLLDVFWHTHNPTTFNRQGNDVGPQYRSIIFYHDDQQRVAAETMRDQLDQSGVWPDPIVTQIAPFEKFYPAEDYHQNYFANNPSAGYCTVVINPKVEKFSEKYRSLLKDAN